MTFHSDFACPRVTTMYVPCECPCFMCMSSFACVHPSIPTLSLYPLVLYACRHVLYVCPYFRC